MAGSAATPGWFKGQGMWEGSIASFEGEIRRRPYHRNCKCALHRSRAVPADAPCSSHFFVTYPIRRRSSSWHSLTSCSSSGNLAAAAAVDVNPRVSLDGGAADGGTAFVALLIDDED
ncbi:uncharacterized protein LOC110023580 [Phalaenopsis equestris]|uniref:uncharacterized protein LOC110023580 n=1 Tax=Phalaenopsis equestris TaxID=78828 RepID=UPI0009E5183A|nr:uncharacterized protein LOC110023580 [Phalaenopsis equestris]